MSVNFKKILLLTGAGFTANFGGFLAREMWSKIFNNPDLDQAINIKQLLRFNYDFEDVFFKVMNDPAFSQDDRNRIQNAIINGYKSMDQMIKLFIHNNERFGVNLHGVRKFLSKFQGGSGAEIGAHFTLNQDLFIERHQMGRALGLETLKYKEYYESIDTGRMNPDVPVILPDQAFIDKFKKDHLSSIGNFTYIKLHGSYGWSSFDGKYQMVLGLNKKEAIEKEPLLKWYFDLFEAALLRSNIKLFVVGYGFRDDHINECLYKGIKEYGLKIYVISAEDPEHFGKRIMQIKNGTDFFNAIMGYFPYKLSNIFPYNQTETDIWIDLLKII